MKAVNLLSQELKPSSRRPGRAALALVLALTVGVALTAAAYMRAEDRVATRGDQIAGLERQLALARMASRSPASQGAPAMSPLQGAVIEKLEGREDWGGLLRGVGRVLPSGTWLTKLSVTEPGVSIDAAAASAPQTGASTTMPPATGEASGGTALALTGCALGQGLVGRAVDGVDLLSGAGEVSVSSSRSGQEEGSSCGEHPGFQLSVSVSEGAS